MYRAIALVRRSVFQPTPKTALTIARIVTPKGQPQRMLRGRTIGGTHVVRPRIELKCAQVMEIGVEFEI
jgi:hypothetical protein